MAKHDKGALHLTRFRIGFFALVAFTAVAVWALPATAQQSATRVSAVAVTAGKPTEFAFRLSKLTVPHGVVVFKVTNGGALPHDFKVGGKVTPQLQPGKSATLKVTFKRAGKFPYICTVTGHAAAGMKGVLKVT